LRKLAVILSVFALFVSAAFAQLSTYTSTESLEQFHNKVPLATQPFDYSQESLAVTFDQSEAAASFELLDGSQVVKRTQTHMGVPVFGADINETSGEKGGKATTGRFANIYDVDVNPTVGAELAKRTVAKFVPHQNMSAELMVYPAKNSSLLVWVVEENGFASDWIVFVDAHTGDIINAYQNIHTGTGTGVLGDSKPVESSVSGSTYRMSFSEGGASRATYTSNNGTSLPGTLMSDSDDVWNATSQRAAVDAHHYAGWTLDFFRNQLNRNSFDGNGAQVRSTVNYSNNYVNAFWNGSQMVYGDGDGSTALALSGGFDVVAHEISHAVTQYTSGLIYQNESGALNEAFSDIMAAAAEYYYQPSQFDWLLGEDIWTPATSGDALRYMNDPTVDGSSRDHYSSRYTGSQDNGGVHWNSGIANLAFQLSVDGGIHPRSGNYGNSNIVVPALGMDKAMNIFYQGIASLSASSDFADARTSCINAATSLYGTTEADAIKDAWAAVGVGSPASGGGGGGGGGTGGELSNGDSVSGLSATTGNWIHYYIDVPAGATNFVASISGGSGDADLYTRLGSEPTTSSYNCRPYRSGNSETCTEASPSAGRWYVSIRAYSSFSSVTLNVSYDAGSGGGGGSNDTLNLTGLSGARRAWAHYTVDVNSAADMRIAMSGGSGDADLYVRYGARPTTSSWDYRPYLNGNNETVNISNAQTGTWHISIRGYSAYSGVSLQVTYP
jgi:vibriolysin